MNSLLKTKSHMFNYNKIKIKIKNNSLDIIILFFFSVIASSAICQTVCSTELFGCCQTIFKPIQKRTVAATDIVDIGFFVHYVICCLYV